MKLQPTTKALNEQESIAVLNAILVGYEYLECLDLIENTTLFRHSLKMAVKRCQDELQKGLVSINDLNGVDNPAMLNIMENHKQLIKKIAPLRPELKSGLNQLLDMYFQMPELLLHRLGIKIIDRDK